MNNTIKNYLNNTHAILFAFIALYTLIILISASIPMFWDMEYISKISNHIYDNNFSSLIFSDTDSGATPLYSTYLAVLWVIFGKSLFVNHIAILPFVTGILFQYYKLANRFLDKKYVVFSFIILLLEPTITSQTILAGYDLVFCFLFLFGLNSVFDNNRYKIALSVIAMPLLNSRGFSLVCSIFLIDFYINSAGYSNIKKFLKNIAAYLPAIIFLIVWLLYHYMSTGWFIVSGSRERFHHISGLEEIFRNLIYIAWKINDFGRVVIYFVIFILAYKVIKSNKSTSKKHINSASLRGFYRSNPIIAILV
ncbi:MAG: hypothetical protein HGB12_15895, partial [Bacteroidetes bacterium]|nr:hypothetical protein [Bacteroidota bacterium]